MFEYTFIVHPRIVQLHHPLAHSRIFHGEISIASRPTPTKYITLVMHCITMDKNIQIALAVVKTKYPDFDQVFDDNPMFALVLHAKTFNTTPSIVFCEFTGRRGIKIEKVDRTDVAKCTQYMVDVKKMVQSADGCADVGKALKNKCNQLLASL